MSIRLIYALLRRVAVPSRVIIASFLILCTNILGLEGISHAQATLPITPSGLNTHVNGPVVVGGKTQFNITGGTRPNGGLNLFHSFGEFGVPTNNIANFLNETALPTNNILGRVTSGNISNIFGTIQTTGFGNANLFLMNPAGFLFGPNATVNVGGMVAFTSADYLKLTDNARFNATPNAAADALLTALPVASFGFLGSNPGAITVQGSQFTVTERSGISLVGGNITIQSGMLEDATVQPARLTAPGGQINLGSATSAGEILSSNLQLGANVNGESFTSLGSITISQDAHIDTAGATGGTIAIRGGQLTIRDGATIASAASSTPSAQAGSFTLNGTGVQVAGSNVVINGTDISVTGSKVTAVKLDGSGGTITVTAGNADHPGNVTVAQNGLLDASGTSGGNINIRGKQLVIDNATIAADTGNVDGAPIAIDINITDAVSLSHADLPVLAARTSGTGNAGDILVSSGSLDATFSSSMEIESLIDSHTMGSGDAGNVTITTGPLTMNGDPFAPGYFIDSGTGGEGNGGNVSITAGDAHFNSGGINTGDTTFFGVGSGGNLTIRAESLLLERVPFATDSFNARAGTLTFEISGLLHITVNSFVSNISLLGENPITLKADHLIAEQGSRILSGTALNDGGDANISARIVEFREGSSISTQTFGDGDAGSIHLTATESVHLLDDPNGTSASGLYTTSIGTPEFGSFGKAGNITVKTPRLEITNGARINSTTLTAGRGGDVTITESDNVSITGERTFDVPEEMFGLGGTRASGIYTRTAGSDLCAGTCGDAGHVNIITESLTLQNGGLIDSGTTNNGQGGKVNVLTSNQLSLSGTMTDGTPGGIFSRTVGTTPDAGAGGNIALTAGQSVTISDGASVSSSSKGPGNTGNIQINAGQSFVATNSNSAVTTDADAASGGTIKISTTPSGTVQLINSTISASVLDGTGGGGSVNIDPQFVILQNSKILANADAGAWREYLHHDQSPLTGRQQCDLGVIWQSGAQRHRDDSIAERPGQRQDSAAG